MAKATSRRALGRGLTALIPQDSMDSGSDNEIVLVDIHAIRCNPFQPRTTFDEKEIAGLAESIKNQGLLQPIVLRKKVDGYEIISGERRLRALKHLGRNQAPSIVRPQVSDREMLELALVENIQRQDLNDIETAFAYQRLLLECSLSHEDLAARVGKSRSAVTNCMRLLKLPEEIQSLVKEKKLSMGHARALLSVLDPAQQLALAHRIVAEDLSVRALETTLKPVSPKNGRHKAEATVKLDADMQQTLERLQYRIGGKVCLVAGTGAAGKIEIRFHTRDDLHRILSALVK
ncbi:MAG: ParB/RepB/Spo0J family partition protein [Chitinivibrionales bacterium]|nr:ParB/RepB/Spo0J family partition protein [Chitinivibrionales bacterium]